MPELPEVETIRRQLAPHVEGRVLQRVEILDARWSLPRAPAELIDAVQGRRVERLGRRGKYFIFELADEVFLLVHLRMTGNLLLDPAPGTPYQRVIFTLDDGHELRFCDPRRFGTGELALGLDGLEAFFDGKLGIEPLGDELTGPALKRWRAGGARRSRRSCSTSATLPASATSTPTRRCFARGSIRCDRPASSAPSSARSWSTRSSSSWRRASTPAARRSMTSATRTASPVRSRTTSWCTCGVGSRATPAARR